MKLLYLKPHFIDFTMCIKLLEYLQQEVVARLEHLQQEKSIYLLRKLVFCQYL